MPSSGVDVSTRNFWWRFANVYVSPGPAFADIARRPDFLWPLLALVISAVAMTETMLAKIGMERIIRSSLEQGGQAASMSAEQMQLAVERGAGIASIFAHLSGLLGMPIYLLIIAGLGLAIVNGIFGGKISFKTSFSVASYAHLPGILGAVMALAVILFGDPGSFNPQNPVPANVGFFLNPYETSKPVLALASSMDLFTVWCLILLGIGLSEAAGRKVRATSITLTYFGLWMVWVLGKVGLAMMG